MRNVTGMRLVANPDGSYDIVSKRTHDPVTVSPTGSPLRQLYKRKYNERHSAVYIPTKEINMYDRIQSFAAQCDIVSLMARAKTDPSVLNQRQGFYGDFSGVGSMQDMLGAYNNMKGAFETLGEKEKDQLGGSFENFLSGIASGAFTGADSAQGVSEAPEKETEVNADEQK